MPADLELLAHTVERHTRHRPRWWPVDGSDRLYLVEVGALRVVGPVNGLAAVDAVLRAYWHGWEAGHASAELDVALREMLS